MTKKIIILIFSFLSIYSIKYFLIENYAVNVPFGDQWDGEAFFLYKPYLENTLTFTDLFNQHNEHRIFFTRLLNLLIFIFNNHIWNTILIMKVQAVLISIIPCILIFYYINNITNYSFFTLFYILIIFSLPIGYENLLWGFQSQFYFMIMFSLISFYLVSSYNLNKKKIFILFILCIFSYLNIASGFTTSIIVSFIFILKYFNTKQKKYLLSSIFFLSLGIFLYKMIILVPGHSFLKAPDLISFIDTFLNIIKWPLEKSNVMIFLLWLPIFYLIGITLYNIKTIKVKNYFFISILLWILLQTAGISYARGGYQYNSMQNRYTDIYLLTGVSLFMLFENYKIYNKSYLYLVYKVVIMMIFIQYSYNQIDFFRSDLINKQKMLSELNILYTQKITNYNDAYKICLKSVNFRYPYPFNERLWMFVNDSTINKFLPVTIKTN